jgi:hypothetical protein
MLRRRPAIREAAAARRRRRPLLGRATGIVRLHRWYLLLDYY